MSVGHRPAAARPRRRSEAGVVGGVEVLPFGFLVFVAGALLLANLWAVVDAKLAVEDAAREAARAYVEAEDEAAAGTAASSAARDSIAGAGRNPSRLGLTIDRPRFARCAAVSVTTSYRVAALTVPFLGGLGSGFTVRGRHREIIDPFAAGAAPENVCAF